MNFSGFDVVIGDILRIPYCSERFDFFLCIAVIHHLSTMARRIEAVWAKEQRGISKSEPSYYVNRKTKTVCNVNDSPESLSKIVEAVPGTYLPLHVNGTEFQNTDMLVPWKKKNYTVTDQLKGKYTLTNLLISTHKYWYKGAPSTYAPHSNNENVKRYKM
ncbi:unnamed protein product [Schistosoma curassoni]|uniref:Methyltransferase type 11 domain-containing protein n=1 Tax=Schistosoma curassoni TaxID=6186 RepID=A0A3P7YWV6_9TREM|nr:unnamed protein product [Schistosoma curassoni]